MNKIKINLNASSPNMSNFGNSGVEIEVSIEIYNEIIENDFIFLEDDSFEDPNNVIKLNEIVELTCRDAFINEELEDYTDKEIVSVWRCEVIDRSGGFLYQISEIGTINTSNDYKELNQVYYVKTKLDGNPKYEIMNDDEIETFNEEWDYECDNRDNGTDIYELKKFNLNTELNII
jgi:hypothetical protein